MYRRAYKCPVCGRRHSSLLAAQECGRRDLVCLMQETPRRTHPLGARTKGTR